MANALNVTSRTSIYVCGKCGLGYADRKNGFPPSYSQLHKGTGSMHVCKKCAEEVYNEFLVEFGSPEPAVHHFCRKLDLYWNPRVYDLIAPMNTPRSMMNAYMARINVSKLAGRSYDDTLKEGFVALVPPKSVNASNSESEEEAAVNPKLITFWGKGFPSDYYAELDGKYKGWTRSLGALDPAEQAIYKQICLLEVIISRDGAAGKPIDKHVNSLNTLLGSANLKPAQRKNDDADAELDNMPFGVGIKKWENTRPIPEPDPELQDVDGLIRYISIWFLGHLCKMVGIRNSYSKLYEEEIGRLRVENPEFEDDDDETLFESIFGEGDASG